MSERPSSSNVADAAFEENEHGTAFGIFEADFLFVPKVRLLNNGLYLIRRRQKKLWSDIRRIVRCDAGIWSLCHIAGSYVQFRGGGSVWISGRILRKQTPVTSRLRAARLDRTDDYDFLMQEITEHADTEGVSVYAPGLKHRLVANAVRLAWILFFLGFFIFWLLQKVRH